MLASLVAVAAVGLTCGLIPLSVAKKTGRERLGTIGFFLCVISSFLFWGVISALPLALVLGAVIAIIGPEKKPVATPVNFDEILPPAEPDEANSEATLAVESDSLKSVEQEV